MSLKMYPAYKVTNSMLLGKIPNHWQAIRLGSALNIKKDIVGDAWSKHLLLSLTLRGVIPRDMENRMGKLPADFTTYQRVFQGDLIFCLFDVEETPRTVGWVPEEGMITGAYTAAYVKPSFDSRYISYHYLSYDQRKSLRGYYAGLRNTIRSTDFSNIPIAYPPIAEQQSIVSYLDRETAEIDEFIADQEELIALLSERRTATIAQAITKGLNLNAPVKDSGVEWLGKVPAHWQVGLCKHTGTIALGKMLQPSSKNEEDMYVPYLRAANVQPHGRLDLANKKSMWFSATEVNKLNLRCGDVVIVEGGVGGFGRAAYLDRDLTGWGFQNSIVRLRPREDFNGKFLAYAFLHLRAAGYISMTASVTSMPHFTAEKVAATMLAWPGSAEQVEIAAYLDRETAEIDAAIADAREAIALSQERRAAVISAAVTGKIDVRGLVGPEAKDVEDVSVGIA